eukprot:TRINITY_DN837_c1_g1_i1.p1 TRINITY_DN837_c1_g1~~TRINITY_DN837_c1_g1_i1.p1  ORF type:complete len:313 (-),score=49.14 TRINITY_DN837_c1_g1_i1:174-1049(-)
MDCPSPNLRDVASAWPSRLAKARLFRCSKCYTTETLQRLGVRTIIDLREHAQHPTEDAFCGQGKRMHFDLLRGCVKLRILGAMNFCTRLKLACAFPFVCLCREGGIRRMAAESLVDNAEAAAERGESGCGQEVLYRALLDGGGAILADALRLLTVRENLPALVHCEHGKDRTGLFVMLVLLICGCPLEHIVEDYKKSAAELQSCRTTNMNGEWYLRGFEGEMQPWMLSDKMIKTPPLWMQNTLHYLQNRYGSHDAFVAQLGLSSEELVQIRANMTDELDDDDTVQLHSANQ